jgi:hypothetical protein
MLFACPRISPEYELKTLHALMKPKPHTRGAVEHRRGEQDWPPSADATLDDTIVLLRDRIGLAIDLVRPGSGEYHFLAEYAPAQAADLLAFALLISRRLPEIWFTLDRLFVRGGVCYRRQFGYKLNLVPATNVHLPRAVRGALRGAL